jgi:hypothetical protein
LAVWKSAFRRKSEDLKGHIHCHLPLTAEHKHLLN